MVFHLGWGIQVSQYADRQQCPGDIAAAIETGVLDSTAVPQHMRDVACNALGDSFAELEAMAAGILEMYDESGAGLDRSKLSFYYTSLSLMLRDPRTYDNSDELAAYQLGGLGAEPIDADTFLWLYILGPVAVNDFPPHWYRRPAPSPGRAPLQALDCGVLRGGNAVGAVFASRGSAARHLYTASPPEGSAGEDALRAAVNGGLRHVLSEQMVEALLGKVGGVAGGGGDQWETVDVEEGPADLVNPDWATLKQGTDGVDLSRCNQTLLDAFKEKMEVEFQKKAIKMDDPNWKYDSRVEFEEPTEGNEWDSD